MEAQSPFLTQMEWQVGYLIRFLISATQSQTLSLHQGWDLSTYAPLEDPDIKIGIFSPFWKLFSRSLDFFSYWNQMINYCNLFFLHFFKFFYARHYTRDELRDCYPPWRMPLWASQMDSRCITKCCRLGLQLLRLLHERQHPLHCPF